MYFLLKLQNKCIGADILPTFTVLVTGKDHEEEARKIKTCANQINT